MDGVSRKGGFYPGAEEQRALTWTARAIFRGEAPDPEAYEDCRMAYWATWVQLFLPLAHNQAGHFVHWPFDGGYMEQPATTMRILRIVQSEYFAYIQEANKVSGSAR